MGGERVVGGADQRKRLSECFETDLLVLCILGFVALRHAVSDTNECVNCKRFRNGWDQATELIQRTSEGMTHHALKIPERTVSVE